MSSWAFENSSLDSRRRIFTHTPSFSTSSPFSSFVTITPPKKTIISPSSKVSSINHTVLIPSEHSISKSTEPIHKDRKNKIQHNDIKNESDVNNGSDESDKLNGSDANNELDVKHGSDEKNDLEGKNESISLFDLKITTPPSTDQVKKRVYRDRKKEQPKEISNRVNIHDPRLQDPRFDIVVKKTNKETPSAESNVTMSTNDSMNVSDENDTESDVDDIQPMTEEKTTDKPLSTILRPECVVIPLTSKDKYNFKKPTEASLRYISQPFGTNRQSCHNCKKKKDKIEEFWICQNQFRVTQRTKQIRTRRPTQCRNKYCMNCLQKNYLPPDVDPRQVPQPVDYHCPSCENRCLCKKCLELNGLQRKREKSATDLSDINKLSPSQKKKKKRTGKNEMNDNFTNTTAVNSNSSIEKNCQNNSLDRASSPANLNIPFDLDVDSLLPDDFDLDMVVSKRISNADSESRRLVPLFQTMIEKEKCSTKTTRSNREYQNKSISKEEYKYNDPMTCCEDDDMIFETLLKTAIVKNDEQQSSLLTTRTKKLRNC